MAVWCVTFCPGTSHHIVRNCEVHHSHTNHCYHSSPSSWMSGTLTPLAQACSHHQQEQLVHVVTLADHLNLLVVGWSSVHGSVSVAECDGKRYDLHYSAIPSAAHIQRCLVAISYQSSFLSHSSPLPPHTHLWQVELHLGGGKHGIKELLPVVDFRGASVFVAVTDMHT